MYCKLTLAALVLLIAHQPVHAATSESSRSFTVDKDLAAVVEWYEANRQGVFAASNCQVLQDLGNGSYKVQTDTPAGTCIYVLKETREDGMTMDGRARTSYHISYVRNVSGRVAGQQLAIVLTQLDGKTEVAMSMTTTVSGRLVPVFAVRAVQKNSLAGSQRFIMQAIHEKR